MKNLLVFDEDLDRLGYPRAELLRHPSPICYLSTLSDVVGCPIYIKRDDVADIGLGGNKLRKLEYLMAEARSRGATRIITIGAMQSNHARLTACVARMFGLKVDLVLKDSVPNEFPAYLENGNILLNRVLEVKIHKLRKHEDALSYARYISDSYKEIGEESYVIPVGGSNLIGSLGYLRAAHEMDEQFKLLQMPFGQIAVATGSGGTHAGLYAGFLKLGRSVHLRAYNVQPEQEPLLKTTHRLFKELSALLNIPAVTDLELPQVINGYSGEQYGIPSAETLKAIQLLAQTEGIFLDPVYTGKAFAGLLADLRAGRFDSNLPTLFIHTGGIPGLFAYSNYF